LSSYSGATTTKLPQINTAAVGIDGELATVVNIDVFDDQLSL